MNNRILLIVSGGIAAYKTLELVRLLRKSGIAVRTVLTQSAKQFVTPLSFGVLTEDTVYDDLFDLKAEREIGHIELSRQADLVVVAPATANIVAKMANGIADDLATTLLLATDKPVLVAPAMNVKMWEHPATQRNIAQIKADGVHVMEPDEGVMACNEWGKGRLPDPQAIAEQIYALLPHSDKPREAPARNLDGRHVLITAGPTHEPIDPVRYIANRSSGKQGFAIARAAAAAGASVTLVAGPVNLPTPDGVTRIDVTTAREMLAAVVSALPADVAIMVAAVADWRTDTAPEQKIKKSGNAPAPLMLVENPDILATLGHHDARPTLVVGFAAETEKLVDHAMAKLTKKGADWIVANDVSGDVMGGERNRIHIVSAAGIESWSDLPKEEVATRLIEKVANAFPPARD